MAIDITPATTGTNLLSQDAASLRQKWHKGALLAEEEEDFFQQFEGNERAPIWVQKDLSKGDGAKMTFTTTSGYYGEGQYGEGLFEGPDDYEKDDIDSFELKVDYIRNAASRSKRADEIMGLMDELKSMVPVKLGKWLGRVKRDNIMGLCTLTLPQDNRIYAGGKTLATLGSADVLSWDDVVITGAAMKPLGGLPANVAANGSNPIWSQNFIPSETAALSLRLDPDYKTVLSSGDVRGRGNTLFKGGYPAIDGHTIIPHNALNHAGKGAVGSFLAPEAFLGLAIAGYADTARTLSGGGSDNADDALTGTGKPLWFKYFGGHDFQFVDTGVLDVSASAIGDVAGPYYAIIYNTSGANAGKWGFVKYTTGNDGNSIDVTEFLTGQADGTYRKGTVGSVTWNAAINTEVWASGALIIPANAKGVPFGHTIAMGRAGIVRGYGSERAKRDIEMDNGNFIKRVFIMSIFGQALRRDRKNRVPAVALLTHALNRPGINLPTIA
jgi:hypothetical protein